MKGRQKSAAEVILPVGQYLFQIESVKDSQTKERIPKANLVLVVCGGDQDGERINHSVTFFPPGHKYGWITDQFLAAIGEQKDGETNEFVYDTETWPERKFMAGIEHGEYNGQAQNKLRSIKPAQKEELIEGLDKVPF